MQHFTTRRLTAAAAAVLILVAAGCGDGGVTSGDAGGPGSSGPTSTVPDTTDTTVPDTTADSTVPDTTDAPDTTAVPDTTEAPPDTTEAPPDTTSDGGDGPLCSDLDPLQGSADVLSSGTADWAGDGTSATVTLYDTAPGAGDFRLRVEHPDGSSEIALITDGLVAPAYLGPVQVDFSLGSDQPQPEELLVVVGANAAGFNVGVYFKDDEGCLARFTDAGESPLELPVRASAGSSSGLACDGGGGSQFIVRTEAAATANPGEYDTLDVKLERDGSRLLDETSIPGTVVDDGTPSSPLVRYTTITNCPGVSI